MEYLTSYPKTVSYFDGIKHKIDADSKNGVEQLHIVVKKSFEELTKIFAEEGFTKVKLEHKQPDQIGNGLNLKLKKPWEMHVRMIDLKKGLIGIHAEVEVSRDYLQHLFLPENTCSVRGGGDIKKNTRSITTFGTTGSKRMCTVL